MKRFFWIMFILFVAFILSNCQKTDSIEAVKTFKPDDKYFKASLITLHFITETAAISRIDSVFKQTFRQYDLPVTPTGCPDGIYTGESPYDAFDYKHVITLEIEDERIITADYDEINRDGTGKKLDAAYNEEMRATGTAPAEAYTEMEAQLIKEQNIMHIDAVSGATYSLYRLRYATTVAFMKALLNKSPPRNPI